MQHRESRERQVADDVLSASALACSSLRAKYSLSHLRRLSSVSVTPYKRDSHQPADTIRAISANTISATSSALVPYLAKFNLLISHRPNTTHNPHTPLHSLPSYTTACCHQAPKPKAARAKQESETRASERARTATMRSTQWRARTCLSGVQSSFARHCQLSSLLCCLSLARISCSASLVA